MPRTRPRTSQCSASPSRAGTQSEIDGAANVHGAIGATIPAKAGMAGYGHVEQLPGGQPSIAPDDRLGRAGDHEPGRSVITARCGKVPMTSGSGAHWASSPATSGPSPNPADSATSRAPRAGLLRQHDVVIRHDRQLLDPGGSGGGHRAAARSGEEPAEVAASPTSARRRIGASVARPRQHARRRARIPPAPRGWEIGPITGADAGISPSA